MSKNSQSPKPQTPVIGILSDPKYNQGAVDAVNLIKRDGVNVITSILDFNEITIKPCDLKKPVDALEKIYGESFDRLAKQQLATVNGLFLPGDENDVPPELYGEQKHRETDVNPDPRRTLLVRALIRNAQEFDIMPSLAICGSLQQYAALSGGKVIQHVPDIPNSDTNHSQAEKKHEASAHSIHVSRFTDRVDARKVPVASTLYGIVQSKEARRSDPEGKKPCDVWVNSIHHQAADGNTLMDSAMVTARAPDGIVEALEPIHNLPFIALQFHPELVKRKDRNGNSTLTTKDYNHNPYGNGIDFDWDGHKLPTDPGFYANQRILEDLVDKAAAHYTKSEMHEELLSLKEKKEVLGKLQINSPLSEELSRGFVGFKKITTEPDFVNLKPGFVQKETERKKNLDEYSLGA